MKEIKLKGLDESIYYDKCENGLDIYIWKNPRVNTFKTSLVFKCGAEDTSFTVGRKKQIVPSGTAHFLEHILCKMDDGTSLLGAFNKLNAYSNAVTYPDKTIYEFVGSTNLQENLELLLDSIQEKKFFEEYFEAERGPILEEARMRKDDISRIALYKMNECLFSKYPNRVSGLGTMEDIQNMKLKNLELFYHTFYHPQNSFIVITGNIDPLKVIHIIKENQKKKQFSKWVLPRRMNYKEPKKVTKKYEEIKVNVEIPKVFISIKIPKANFKNVDDITTLYTINVILSSNFGVTSLFREELFEKNLAITLGAGAYLERDFYIIQISAKTKYPEELIPILQEKCNHLEIMEQDNKRKIKSEIANLVLGYEDVEDVNDTLVYYLVKYGKIIENEKEILENMSMKQIQMIFENLSFKEMSTLVMYPLDKQKDEK